MRAMRALESSELRALEHVALSSDLPTSNRPASCFTSMFPGDAGAGPAHARTDGGAEERRWDRTGLTRGQADDVGMVMRRYR